MADPLFLGGDDVTGHDRQHRPVHRHRHAHGVQWDPVEQDLGVLDAVNRDPGLADIAFHARMIGVIAAVRGQVKGDAQPFLAAGKSAAVEGI